MLRSLAWQTLFQGSRRRFSTSISKEMPTLDHGARSIALQMMNHSNQDENCYDNQGIVLDIKNSVAYVSGLLNASLGSTVFFHNKMNQRIAGIVLNLEKDSATVAIIDKSNSIQIGSPVAFGHQGFKVPIGKGNFGRIINPMGEPIDGAGPIEDSSEVQIFPSVVPRFLSRSPQNERLTTGFSSIDCFYPLGYGSRLAVFGEKSSECTRFALDAVDHQMQLNNNRKEDQIIHCVYVIIGKTEQWIKQITNYLRDTGAMERTAIVVSSESDPLVTQFLAPFVGCSIAESVSFSKGNAMTIYDDLTTHYKIVNDINSSVQHISTLYSQSTHATLLERSGKMNKGSITTLALALVDADDSSNTHGFSSSILSATDDSIRLDSRLFSRKVYPPIDCLVPGHSIKGPPFQSATLWNFVQEIREIILQLHTTEENTKLAKAFGIEADENMIEIMDYREIVEELFCQRQGQIISQLDMELGAFIVAKKLLVGVPRSPKLSEFIPKLHQHLKLNYPNLYCAIDENDFSTVWSRELQIELEQIILKLLRQ